MRSRLARKVLEYKARLQELLNDERIVYSLLADQTIRDDFLFVVGALRIRVPLAPAVARGVSSGFPRASSRAPWPRPPA